MKYEKFTVWAAWGTSINKRKYLIECLKDIVKMGIHIIHYIWIIKLR